MVWGNQILWGDSLLWSDAVAVATSQGVVQGNAIAWGSLKPSQVLWSAPNLSVTQGASTVALSAREQ